MTTHEEILEQIEVYIMENDNRDLYEAMTRDNKKDK